MSYVCSDPESYDGEVVGTGQCVAFVQQCSGAPNTGLWTEGIRVRGNRIARGTAIATFINRKYPSKSTGNHAAIYLEQDEQAIWVYDQWSGHPVSKRAIRFKGGKGSPSNDGDAFSVID